MNKRMNTSSLRT